MPTPTSAISRPELGATFQEFGLAADRAGFIGVRALRPRIVAVSEGEFPVVPIEYLLGVAAAARTNGAGYSRSDFRFGTTTYKTQEYGHEEVLDDRAIRMYADLIDCESIHAERAIDAVARVFEQQVIDAISSTTTWTGSDLTTALGTAWSTTASADPAANIEAARQKVIAGSGLVPNALILNREAWWCLKSCDAVVDAVKYAGFDDPTLITTQAVAQLLDLEMILVSSASKNTATEGATAAMSPMWPDGYALLARVATTEDPGEACLGRALFWTEDGGSSPTGDQLIATIEQYREEQRRGSIIRARADWAIKVLLPAAAHLLSNVTA